MRGNLGESRIYWGAALALGVLVWGSGCSTPLDRHSALSMARNQDRGCRAKAAERLAHYRDDESRSALRELAVDSEPGVRGRAIQALGVVGDKGALRLLVEALTDRELWRHCTWRFPGMYRCYGELICETAHASLVSITGYKVPFDANASENDREAAVEQWRALVLGMEGERQGTRDGDFPQRR